MAKTNEEILEKRYQTAKQAVTKVSAGGTLREKRQARKSLRRAQRKRTGLKRRKARHAERFAPKTTEAAKAT